MANSNNSNSKTAFDNMKYEIANQLGISLKQGYNGDLTSREAGTIGGNIVKKVFQSYTEINILNTIQTTISKFTVVTFECSCSKVTVFFSEVTN